MINCKLAEFHLSPSLINGFITASFVHTMLVINYSGRSNQKGNIPHEHAGLSLQKHVVAFLQTWPLACMFPVDHPSSTLRFKVVSKLALSPLAVAWDPGTDVYVEPSWCGTVTGWNILNKPASRLRAFPCSRHPFLLLTSARRTNWHIVLLRQRVYEFQTSICPQQKGQSGISALGSSGILEVGGCWGRGRTRWAFFTFSS